MSQSRISRIDVKPMRIPNVKQEGIDKVSQFNKQVLNEINKQPEVQRSKQSENMTRQPGVQQYPANEKGNMRFSLPTITNVNSIWTIGGIAVALTILRAWVFRRYYSTEYNKGNIFAQDPLKWLDLMIGVSLAIPIINSV